MKIKDVIIKPATSSKGLIDFASLILDDQIALNSIAIYRKLSGGYRLLYPSKKSATLERTIFHPIDSATSKAIEDAIFAECKNVFEQGCENDRYDSASVRR